jgi:drug/metabolite transporter (DMT)-like permease
VILAGWLWAIFTLIAAAAQTVRNATQRSLTKTLGTVGATQVRFLFGFPFSLLFLLGVIFVLNRRPPTPDWTYWLWVTDGAAAQFAATALMLAAMSERSFVVAIAYIKTEPLQVALFGLVLLGDRVTWPMALAIVTATAGVVLMSVKPGALREGGWKPTAMGLGSGALYGLSSIGYRGAILSLNDPSFVMTATFTLVIGLALQTVFLTIYLYIWDRPVLVAIFRAWRPSLFAGFMGAFASQFWYLAFAIATAASVRTLALIEVLFAQGISRFVFKQPTTRREMAGIVLIVIGCLLLIWAY